MKGRRWSWAALLGILLVFAAAVPTWGLSIFLLPVTLALSVVAWFRSERDLIFWCGLAANVLFIIVAANFLYEAM